MKKTVLALALMLFGLMAAAKPVDQEAARNVATNFWNAHRDAGVAAVSTMQTIACPFDGMYIFAAGEKGFVIVASDDCVQPILGYSFHNPASEQLNPEVRYWLGTYQDQIAWMRDNGVAADVADQWMLYSTASQGDPRPLTAVSPLLSTTWGQDPYYNNLCPYDNTEGERTPTGCVATATAQVMKYWNHPTQGTGSHSYTHSDYGTQSANFGTTTYNWSSMPNALTSASSTAQVNAVATLMYHIGVAVEMNYGVDGSGAQMANYGYSYTNFPSTQGALPLFFGYVDSIVARYRTYESISDAQWKAYIKAELDASRPVLYSGFDSTSGHAFVCDGYNSAETQFHFNWGWSGYYDGYFALSNLNPLGGGTGSTATNTFNLNQQILTNVKPNANASSGSGISPDPNCLITSFPYTENFDDTSHYSCLRVVNANADSITWGLIANYGYDSSRCAYIMYAVGADDYLILPGITTAGNYTISWKAKAYNASYPESYQVYAGDTMVYSETLSTTSFVTRTATFSVAAGDTVLPMFRYISNDMYAFFIDDITISQSGTPAPPDDSDTISYCENNAFATSVGAGGTLYWGIMLPPSELSGHDYLKSVMLYVVNAGTYTLNIYTGGTSAPGTLAHTQTVTFSSSQTGGWQEILLSSIFSITTTQNLWITFYNNDVNYPAAACTYANNTNSDWTSVDGSSWDHLQSLASSLVYSWMIKAVTTSSIPGPAVSISGRNQVATGQAVTFTATGTTGATITWSLPGATPSTATGNSVTATYAAAGTYNVIATITNSYGTGHDTMQVRVVDYAQGDTVSYVLDRPFATNIGTGDSGTMYWGIMLPASYLTYRDQIDHVLLYSRETGTYTMKVYQGGDTVPQTLVSTTTYTISDTVPQYHVLTPSTPISINKTQNLWVIFTTTGIGYPAGACAPMGDDNSDWISLDGTAWHHLPDYGLNYSWMIKVVTSSATPPTQYTITVNSNNTAWGSVSGGGTYNAGSTVSISATANSGYHFVQWQDGNTSNPRAITVTANATYTATFASDAAQQYTITVLSANESMGTVSGGGTYNEGSTITISATANSGYRFTQWNDGNTSNPRTITVTANATYIANFEATTGIDGIDADSWSLYPNPATDKLTIVGVEQAIVTITDMTGRTLATHSINGGDATIDVSTLAAGAYFVHITHDGVSAVRKLIIR